MSLHFSELNYSNEISEDLFSNHPWKLVFLEKILNLTKKYTILCIKKLSSIDDEESNSNKQYLNSFAEELEARFQGFMIDVDKLYEKHLEIIGKYSDKLTSLELKLGLEPTVDVNKLYENISFRKIEQILENKISELENILTKKEFELVKLKEKHTFLLKKLGLSPVKEIPKTYSPTTIECFKQKVETMEEVYTKKDKIFQAKKLAMEKMIEEYEINLNDLSIRSDILKLSNESIPITEEMLDQLDILYGNVEKTGEEIKDKIKNLHIKLEKLWKDLDYSEFEQLEFLTSIDKISKSNLEKMRNECNRLEILKENNMVELINTCKEKLYKLWDDCHCGGNIRNDFPLINTQECNDDILESLQKEIKKWENYYNEHSEILNTLNLYSKLRDKLIELRLNVNQKKLYENRGGVYSAEIKKMNSLKSQLKKHELTLLTLSRQHVKQKGYAFLTFESTIENFIKKTQNIEKKKTGNEFYISPFNKGKVKTISKTPQAKNMSKTPVSKPLKKVKNKTPTFKINESRTSLSKTNNWKPSNLGKNSNVELDDKSSASEYSDFEREVTSKNIPRSSEVLSPYKIDEQII